MIKVPHSKPSITSTEIQSVCDVMKTGLLAQGQQVEVFEKTVSRSMKLKGAVAVNSGTSALHLALMALAIKPKDEIIIPSYVCTALLNAVLYTGAKPVIVDVDGDTFNISPVQVKRKLTSKTKAVIVPHMFGFPADMKELVRLGVPVIEDCAQTLGNICQGKSCGSWGKITVCSFYATKMITTAEGGMVLSNDRKLLSVVRDLRAYDNANDYKIRYNYKMTDLQAALGLNQIQRLAEFVKRRKMIAASYHEAFVGKDFVIPVAVSDREHVYFRYVVKSKRPVKQLITKLIRQGIDAKQPVFKPLHRYYGTSSCPVSDQLMEQCLSIPIYPELTEQQVHVVVKGVRSL